MASATAAELLAGRKRAVKLLQRLGAVVVEAPPESLGPTCVDAYLTLKRHARL
jgi:hypothetical protein